MINVFYDTHVKVVSRISRVLNDEKVVIYKRSLGNSFFSILGFMN